MNSQRVDVWDLFVRVFHWSLVLCFVVAFITEEEWLSLHVNAGYAVLGLIVMRILWGVIGSPYARFSNFVRGPTAVMHYLADLRHGRAKRYLGHNPAGAMMIILLIVSLLLTTVTGMVVYGAEEAAGPLASLALHGEAWEEVGEELHELFANFTLLLVIVHVAGVVFESITHGENLVKAMFNGTKQDLTRKV